MNLDFLSVEQKAQYGKFSGEPNDIQLARYFHLDEADLEFIANRRGNHNRLGFALQLTSVRFLGGLISDVKKIPLNVQRFVAAQLSIVDVSVVAHYAQREFTKYDHASLIRNQYGYCDFAGV